MKLIKRFFFLLITTTDLFSAQKKLPVLHTENTHISIKEGEFFYKDSWRISPEAKPDVFVVNPFVGRKKISFYSESDSLSFIIKPNRKYDFIVQQKGKEPAYTQIDTYQKEKPTFAPKLTLKSKNGNDKSIADTLHFTLGKNSLIYLKGTVNNSGSLDFIFDTGAGISVITQSLIETKKVNVKLDGDQKNTGTDGVSTVKKSSGNVFEIGSLKWSNVPLLSIDYKGFPFDMVLGWVAFEDKVVELNYETNNLIIHNSLPAIDKEYSKLDIKFINGIPYIQCKTIVNGIESEAWFDFDTGSDGTMAVGQKFAAQNALNNTLKVIGKSTSKGSSGKGFTQKYVLMPKIKVGDFEMNQVPMSINDQDPEGVEHNENIGNVILKRFNAIIDFKNSAVYLKPNRLFYSPL
nr:aspartyl protease family protein [uncultured Chryseobacterium sp.]